MRKHRSRFPDLMETIALVLVCGVCIGAVSSWGWFKPDEAPEPVEQPSRVERVLAAKPVELPVVQPPEPVAEIVSLDVKVVESKPEPEPEPEVVVTEKATGGPAPYTEQELEILAIIIYQEAGGDLCSDATRQMVGEVFLNRVESSRFPDTFEAVATARAQYGRLHWTGLQWPERAVNPGEAHAVERAYKMAQTLLDGSVDRLLPTDVVFQAEFPQGTETLAQSDGFYFCR